MHTVQFECMYIYMCMYADLDVRQVEGALEHPGELFARVGVALPLLPRQQLQVLPVEPVRVP